MTVATSNNTNGNLAIWEQHRFALHQADTFAVEKEGAGGICYVPTAAGLEAGVMGDKVALKQWLAAAGPSPYDLAMRWREQLPADADLKPIQIIKTIASGLDIIEEAVVTFCHDDSIGWLLPGLQPTRKVITLPLVFSITYNGEGKIAGLRVYWDQASVLKQIGTFEELTLAKATALQGKLDGLPMLPASTTAKALMDGGEAMNPFLLKEEVGSSGPATTPSRPSTGRSLASSIVPGDSVSVAHRPSVRLGSQGGFKRADNDIFAPGTPSAKPLSQSGIPANPARYVSHFDGAGVAGQAQATRGKKHFEHNPNYQDSRDSTLLEEDNDGLAMKQRPSTASSMARYHNASQISLSGAYEDGTATLSDAASVTTGRRMGGMAAATVSHDSILAPTAAEEDAELHRKTGKKTSTTKTASQIVIGGPTSDPTQKTSDLHAQGRPSSRVLAPPGGGSSFTLG